MKKLFVTVLLAACGSAPHATTPNNQGGKPVAVGPAPKFAWSGSEGDEGSFDLTGMPAISADGSRVLIADQEQGAGMTPPNLTLRQIDRNDHDADRFVVLPFDTSADPTVGPSPQKVDEGNAYLVRTNQEYGWATLVSVEAEALDPDDGALEDGSKATAGSVVITYKNEHLTVTDAGKVVFDKDEPGWAAPPQNVGTDMQCGNPDLLDTAYIDPEKKAALVQISYKGTDSCWEPSPEMHFIAW